MIAKREEPASRQALLFWSGLHGGQNGIVGIYYTVSADGTGHLVGPRAVGQHTGIWAGGVDQDLFGALNIADEGRVSRPHQRHHTDHVRPGH